MPEGPEVKSVTVYLDRELSGAQLIDITCIDPIKYFQINAKGKECRFNQLLDYLPAVINRVFCKGKCIFFELYSVNSKLNIYLFSHLIMTGRWVPKSDRPKLTLHFGTVYQLFATFIHVQRTFDYEDDRGLGRLNLLTEMELQAKLASLGPDLLSDDISWNQWQNITKRCPRRQLVSFLMEPSLVSGVGNYLKCEILYRARLAPNRKVGSLTVEENLLLYQSALATIKESYSYGGLTIKNFWHPDGKRGTFPTQVYGDRRTKTHDPYGNPISRDKFADGRTTHWVPTIQL